MPLNTADTSLSSSPSRLPKSISNSRCLTSRVIAQSGHFSLSFQVPNDGVSRVGPRSKDVSDVGVPGESRDVVNRSGTGSWRVGFVGCRKIPDIYLPSGGFGKYG